MSRRTPMPADVQQTAAQTPRPVGHPDPGSSAEAQPRPDQSLFRSQGFRSVFRAAAISTLGTQISFLAVPLLAVTALKDRKSTRLNSSHVKISYACFCLKKKRRDDRRRDRATVSAAAAAGSRRRAVVARAGALRLFLF